MHVVNLNMFPFQCLEQSFFCDDESEFTYHIKSSDEQDKQEKEVYFGNTRIEKYMFAVFGPSESTTDTEDEDGDDLKSQLAVNTIKKTDAKGRKEGRGHREGDGEGKTS